MNTKNFVAALVASVLVIVALGGTSHAKVGGSLSASQSVGTTWDSKNSAFGAPKFSVAALASIKIELTKRVGLTFAIGAAFPEVSGALPSVRGGVGVAISLSPRWSLGPSAYAQINTAGNTPSLLLAVSVGLKVANRLTFTMTPNGSVVLPKGIGGMAFSAGLSIRL
jgi:hypothetical protein